MATAAPITGARTRAPSTLSNVCALRPGLTIRSQRPEDDATIKQATIASWFRKLAYERAQTEPNSERHRFAEQMAIAADAKLPRSNLRMLERPLSPAKDWFLEARLRWSAAKNAKVLADSRWNLAWHLDRQDGGDRQKAARIELDRAEAALALATEDALRTPTVHKYDARKKQDMIGPREWAEKYRPAWQAMVDEDLARYPTKPRKPRAKSGQER